MMRSFVLSWVLAAGFSSVVSYGAPVSDFALSLEGDLVQGGVVSGQLPAGYSLSVNDVELPLSTERRFLLGLDRDHDPQLLLQLTDPVGTVIELPYEVEAREYRIQRVQGIKRNIMNPSATDLQRIGDESALVKAARKAQSDRADYWKGFNWPITGRITGVYGSQRVYNGVPGRPHYGVDVAAPVGAPVYAPAAGKVVLAHPNMFYSGGTLIVDHGHGLSSSFLHLSKILVSQGQTLQQGEPIAEVGATGRVTGPHLDWRMNWRGARLDPQLLVPTMASVLKSTSE